MLLVLIATQVDLPVQILDPEVGFIPASRKKMPFACSRSEVAVAEDESCVASGFENLAQCPAINSKSLLFSRWSWVREIVSLFLEENRETEQETYTSASQFSASLLRKLSTLMDAHLKE